MLRRVFGLDGLQHALLPERHFASFFGSGGIGGGFGETIQAAARARLDDQVNRDHLGELHGLGEAFLAHLAWLGAREGIDGQAQQALHAALDGLDHLCDGRIGGVDSPEGAHECTRVSGLALDKAHAVDATDQVAHVLAFARDVVCIALGEHTHALELGHGLAQRGVGVVVAVAAAARLDDSDLDGPIGRLAEHHRTIGRYGFAHGRSHCIGRTSREDWGRSSAHGRIVRHHLGRVAQGHGVVGGHGVGVAVQAPLERHDHTVGPDAAHVHVVVAIGRQAQLVAHGLAHQVDELAVLGRHGLGEACVAGASGDELDGHGRLLVLAQAGELLAVARHHNDVRAVVTHGENFIGLDGDALFAGRLGGLAVLALYVRELDHLALYALGGLCEGLFLGLGLVGRVLLCRVGHASLHPGMPRGGVAME